MDYKNYFKNRKITVMGLGLLGRGVGDIAFLAECGAELLVTDLKTKLQLKESLAKLKKYKNISYVLGEHRLEDFRNRDIVIKAAGVPLDSPFIAEAKLHSSSVCMSTSLFAELTEGTIIGITGTRGKSTTTHLVYSIVKEAYKGKKENIFLGGNVKGVSTLALLPKVKKGDIVVLELDSWQLQGFGDAKISPHISVFTNFMPDHLNYYKGDLDVYFKDKANIFLWQKPEDTLITPPEMSSLIKPYKKKYKGQILIPTIDSVPATWKISIPGEHNKINISLAVAVSRRLKISDEVIKKAVEKYKGVAGRLELIKTIRGVKIYNDTTATTPDATLIALKALSKNRNVVLIMGGADKNIDMNRLLNHMSDYVKAVVLLSGTGSDRIRSDLHNLKGFNTHDATTLSGAVKKVMQLSEKGDVVVLSPAFASFGMFKNEFDRGEKFNAIVSKLS